MAWSVAVTRRASEDRITDDFASVGIRVYYPMERRTRVVRGRRVESISPLLPGYAFFVLTPSWKSVFSLRSVEGILACDGIPLRARDEEIEHIRALEGEDGYVEAKRPRYRKGQLVRSNSVGWLEGFVGTVERIVGPGRVEILFDLLGRKTPITIGEAELTVA